MELYIFFTRVLKWAVDLNAWFIFSLFYIAFKCKLHFSVFILQLFYYVIAIISKLVLVIDCIYFQTSSGTVYLLFVYKRQMPDIARL